MSVVGNLPMPNPTASTIGLQAQLQTSCNMVHCGGSVSRRAQLRSGIAQGSVLGQILYVLYTADVQKLVESFGFRVHLYADDTQFHDSCRLTDAAVLAARAMRVIEAVMDWMSSNRLRLNADKTQFIWLGTSHFLDVLQINSIPANEVVNNLGVYFDPELLMERQVNKLCQVCYFHLRRLRTVRRSLTKESLLTLVHAFITSRVDHCNGVLYGSNGYLLDRLQSVLNSAARLILGVPKFGSVSTAIRNELHWLPIGKRIQFKIALLVRHCIVGAADWTLSSGEFILWSAESMLCLAWWSHCSKIPTSKIWLQGFCCLWPPCVELSSDRN